MAQRRIGASIILTILTLAIWFQPQASQAQASYQVINLGTLGGLNSVANSINNAGQVVGWADTASGAQHAFAWSGGRMTDLNSLLPSASPWVLNVATSINSFGDIVGNGTYTPTPSGPTYPAAFFLHGSTVTLVATGAGANAINDSNQVVGSLLNPNPNLNQAYTWDPTTGLTSLSPLTTGGFSNAYDINNSGVIAGVSQYNTSNQFDYDPTLWNLSSGIYVPTDLGNMGSLAGMAPDGTASAISNTGEVIGWSTINSSATFTAYLDPTGTPNNFINLGNLNGDGSKDFAQSINSSGDIVGSAFVYSSSGNEIPNAWIWMPSSGPMTDLNSLYPNSGTLNSALGINSTNEIVGWGTFNNQQQAFLIGTPVPEPSGLTAGLVFIVLLFGMGASNAARKRRSTLPS